MVARVLQSVRMATVPLTTLTLHTELGLYGHRWLLMVACLLGTVAVVYVLIERRLHDRSLLDRRLVKIPTRDLLVHVHQKVRVERLIYTVFVLVKGVGCGWSEVMLMVILVVILLLVLLLLLNSLLLFK